MAILFDNTIIGTNLTAATFRAWCTFIHNSFLLGFVATADTGQLNLTTVAAPTSTQQVMGYKVYRSNDALTPVYVKVEFASGSSIVYPSIWVSMSLGTNGDGTLINPLLLTRTQLATSSSDAVTPQVCLASGATDRVCFALFLSVISMPLWFSLERRKDANIANADTGLIVDWGSSFSSTHSLCIPFTGVIPTPELGMQFILSTNNPAAYGAVIPEGLRIPCLGPSEPPGRNLAVCAAGDYGVFAQPSLTINVTTHVFKHCGAFVNTLRGGSTAAADPNTRLLMRYE